MVRHKNRYIVLEINETGRNNTLQLKLKGISLQEAILEKVQQLHGDFGVAAVRAGFTAKYFNEHTRVGFIRSRCGPHKLVASSIPCIKTIENKNVVVNILYVGATIRQCFNFLKNYQQRKFDEYCVKLKTDEEKLALKEAMLNFENVLAIL
ncbi:ribonuclease P/MRP protein subunit POP5-like [Anoplophora glabripennis]|uniref:ribonuclease P/MRP protein subunit POP5-like n=1 Tax=Anoplophora glabripennis TaxID=217634 RepID=UPI0008738C46|nr:ribonuclease P/MRP protein subunit POP5-like [Anoplophora glabripennis]XP_018562729.1 ribonuclease P/MRP protein subunit POP5-like [Anoplophora glabripennis]XP_018574079.1 ribonuclease P/MRP protein subunit POP5-like [Anoplophora glabripennis]